MQFKKVSFLIFFFILLIFTGCDSKNKNEQNINEQTISEENSPTTKQTIEEQPNSIYFANLKTTDGKIIKAEVSGNNMKFEGYENKIVLVNFFATWCPPCVAEIPHLNNLIKKYPNDFIVLGILLEQGKLNQEVLDFIDEHNVTYPITNSSANFLLSDSVGGVKTIPTMYLVDKNGEIKREYIGMVLEEMLEIDIKKMLEK